MTVLGGDPGFGEAGAHRGSGRGIDAWGTVKDGRHPIEAPHLVVRIQCRVVGDVVGVAGKAVKGMHMDAQIASDQPGTDRKILAAAPFAGRRLDGALFGRRSLGGQSGHPRYPLALNQATASAIACRAGRGA